MEGLERIPAPSVPVTDIGYEAQLRSALDPVLHKVLDMAESCWWDRRKAAYSMMFLAARALPDGKAKSA